jgi:hypothetical protein
MQKTAAMKAVPAAKVLAAVSAMSGERGACGLQSGDL